MDYKDLLAQLKYTREMIHDMNQEQKLVIEKLNYVVKGFEEIFDVQGVETEGTVDAVVGGGVKKDLTTEELIA